MDRRNFIKKCIAAGVGLRISDPLLLPAHTGRKIIYWPKIRGRDYSQSWMKTIFCQFDAKKYPKLKQELEKCSADVGCKIHYGEKDSPDIIATPCFVAVVDREDVGMEIWEAYIDYCGEAEDDTPCLIIDRRDDMSIPEKPLTKYWERRASPDISNSHASYIASRVRKIKEHVDRVGFAYEKGAYCE